MRILHRLSRKGFLAVAGTAVLALLCLAGVAVALIAAVALIVKLMR